MTRFLMLFALLSAAAGAGAPFELDAPNGSVQSSTVLAKLGPGQTFNLYITPLEQHLGDSIYSTEIQVRFGPVGVAFARMDPTIINKNIDDPDSLPPIWETRSLSGKGARSIEDPRILALGSAGISLEDGIPFLVQAHLQDGLLRVFHRPPDSEEAFLLAKFRIRQKDLPVTTRVIGYKARFTLP